VNTLDENDWFPSSTTSCLYVQICACKYCRAEWDCDGPCPNPLCPSNDPDANYCSCCQQQKDDYDVCINPACSCSPYYNGSSDPGSGGDPGNTNGGNNGSVSGGSGSSSGNSNSTNQRNATTINNASTITVSVIMSSDPDGKKPARCNHGVQEAFKNIFGTIPTELNCKANQMIQNLRNSSNWESVTMAQAQVYASEGWFVIGGWENSSGSGHVVVIVNGSTNGWPNCMDTGYGMRESSQGLNYSFGRDKRNNVEYFKYK